MFRLDGKNALITGAGSGIGQATAILFARQGARVMVADVIEATAQQTTAIIQEAHGDAQPLIFDVSDEAQVTAVFAEMRRLVGRIDILVNNAGVSSIGSIAETSLAEWERVLGVNARGVFLCAREAVKWMLSQTPAGGVIINIASATSLIGVERRFAYTASKGAVLSMTRSIAIDYATQGIRCNAICPGTVQSPFIEAYLARDFVGHEDETRARLAARQPLGRMARPEEIASAALYLASEEAAFSTGAALVIDGGWTAG